MDTLTDRDLPDTDLSLEAVDLHNVDAVTAGDPQVVLHQQLALDRRSAQLQRPAGLDAPLTH